MKRTTGCQGGLALIDALLASAVLGIGLAATAQLALKTWGLASHNRQHTVAQSLAQEAMDCLHSRVQGCPVQDELLIQGVRYTRQTQSTPRDGGLVTDLQVSVRWTGGDSAAAPPARAGEPHADQSRLVWHSSTSGIPLWVGVSSR